MRILIISLLSIFCCHAFAQFETIYCKHPKGRFNLTSNQKRQKNFESLKKYDQLKGKISIKVNPEINYIEVSIKTIYRSNINHFNAFHFLLHDSLSIDSIIVHGVHLNWQRLGDHEVKVNLKDSLNENQLDSILIYYKGSPLRDGLASYVNDTLNNGSKTSWTLSQPYGAKNWWPGKNSLTDKWDRFALSIEMPLTHQAASIGLLKDIDTLGTNHIYHWETRYPIADYLIAFSVAEYELIEQKQALGSDSLLYQHFLYPGDSLGQSQSEKVTPVFMQFFDSLFGPYPFIREKYGHASFTFGGGMEHQTMSFMGNYGGELIAHELAHQWFGNLITCSSWQELWLNEAFATYAVFLTYEFNILHDAIYLPIGLRSLKQATIDHPHSSVFIEDTSRADLIFTALPYRKGAALLHMIRWQIKDSAFFQGIRNYVNDTTLRFGFAKTENLQNHFERSSGIDLNEFFKDWYYGKGHPTFHAAWEQNGSNFKLQINQTQSDPSVYFFNMPLPYQLKGGNWDTIIVVDPRFSGDVFELQITQAIDTVIFDPDLWISGASTITTGLKDVETNKALMIYPNPSSGLFHLKSDQALENAYYEIFNAKGQLISNGKLNSQGIIDLGKPEKGMYYLSFKDLNIQTKLLID